MSIKVCICDDLPHVINAVDSQQRSSPGHELVQSGLILQVGHGRSLTIKTTSQDDNDLCFVNPQTEVSLVANMFMFSIKLNALFCDQELK